ncbi:unnamed protein product [Caenorhabditis sp. 36 PRJEB53466]|nr:unnamed protein product [Caenorhabditis sp. 36 PRJEB53466]
MSSNSSSSSMQNQSVQQPLRNYEEPANQIHVELVNRAIWQKCHEHTNEMIVVPHGRELFPKLKYKVRGLNPSALYKCTIHFGRQSSRELHNYKGKWTETHKTLRDVPVKTNSVVIKEGTGSQLMEGLEGAERLKMYKNGDHRPNQILVSTKCQYIPVFQIFEICGNGVEKLCHEACFSETLFVVTSVYKNKAIKEIKVENNNRSSSSTSSPTSNFANPDFTPTYQPVFNWTPINIWDLPVPTLNDFQGTNWMGGQWEAGYYQDLNLGHH